ncbi:MAG: FAD-binding oxidoreductase [Anaerolineae bacterium]|nr:FAD-binding oxidoreductase [Anaerolineae bacterium]
MRRWNGWGETTTDYPLPETAATQLAAWVGPGTPPHDISWEAALAQVPPSRLPGHPLIDTAPAARLRHARGQSLPDWIALRAGLVRAFPDGVAFPTNDDEVRALLAYARERGAALIPYGGGTSVAGHINPLPGARPVLTANMSRLNRLRRYDEESLLATFGAGVAGPDLEAQLRAHGATLGHYPQSFEYSTLGGWIASRSSGQQSLGYGRIEDLFVGGHVESPAGPLHLPSTFPASAAGPELRQLVLGSEGRLGIITEATVRVSPLPEREDFHAVFFPDFDSGCAATRAMLQAGLPLSMLRLSTAVETETTLALAGHPHLIGALERLLALRGIGNGKAMLLLGFTGPDKVVQAARKAALDLAGDHSGVHAGRTFGNEWHKSRFRTPYLRNTLWAMGYAVDTLETAVSWTRVPATIAAVEAALHDALAGEDERVHVFTHLSHFYSDGCSLYTTYLFRHGATGEETLARWERLKGVASQAIVAAGGTISHQHGVGLDHRPYLPAEKGALGMETIAAVCRVFDPEQMMNPGKLIAGDDHGA